MENLYSKLYDKYNKLKTRKDSDLDRYNHDQEVKFTDYMAGKELSEEVEKLRNLQQEGLSCSARVRYNENGQMESPRGTYLESGQISSISTRKRHSTDEDPDSRGKLPVVTETEKDSHRGLHSDNDRIIQKESCCRKVISSGDSINANCVFHTLMEFLIGMKFEFVTKADGPCLSALHQSSGYSFTLMWLTKASEDEPLELLYHVLSLGTFERIAPEWMREDLIFSSSMCPVFFKRVSSVIGLHL
ncbi:hypothetical protein C5167_045708 [Papaver somniferum]|uniref:DUF7806 domain-containing protein n=1 Tax=Papaver somniferum TaxID=3469 RepID=A0A4Y7LF57_PAPSO|nr:hypothetical protein C5167_045708 [Papaver somniferum]